MRHHPRRTPPNRPLARTSARRVPGLVFLKALFLTCAAAHIIRADVLLLNSGASVSGQFLSLDAQHVKFQTTDGRSIDLDRKEVFGVFTDEIPKNLLKPAPNAKAEIRVGSRSIVGQVIRYDPNWMFVFYSTGGKAKIGLLRPEEKLRYLRIGRSASLDEIDRGPAFGRETLKGMKALSKDNLFTALQLGEEYLKLRPSGKEMADVEILLGSLRKAWKEKVKEFFKLVAVEVAVRSDTNTPMLTYHFYSKMDSFVDLRCRIWVQLRDDTLYSAVFSYFTLRKSNKHYDTVEANKAAARINRWRIVLDYYDEIAATKESDPPGPPGWWDGDSTELTFWSVDEKKVEKAPDTYFSQTLGKRAINREVNKD